MPTVRALRPNGPYRLGGYCVGGLVALEIASRLERAGEEIAYLGIVSSPPGMARYNGAERWLGWIVSRTGLKANTGRRLVAKITRKAEAVRRLQLRFKRNPITAMHWLAERFRPASGAAEFDPSSQIADAIGSYTPPRYDGPLTMIFSTESHYDSFRGIRSQWKRLYPQVIARAVPGDHSAIKTHTKDVARELAVHHS